ncbi:amidohydrolase family protein [Falsigemmobacter intermedius]|uniref:amidohydrolase family protein n=1 Tax=Falsigemmobacter intermedius TaxID=1553448 RepID=UPI003F0D0962
MSGETYDLVIRGGRVMDPETGFDALADVALRGGKIVAIGEVAGSARAELEAEGHLVVPGFIDLHAHGQSLPADRMQAFDGVTTTLEMEAGVLPVGAWYAAQAEAGRTLNYGAAAAWILARRAVMSDVPLVPGAPLRQMGAAAKDRRWSDDIADSREVEGIVALIAQGLDEGAIGIGIPNAYASGSGVKEMTAVCQLAADRGVATYTHVAYDANIDPQSATEAYIRLIGYAGATGAHMHICHLNSTSGTDIQGAARLIRKARDQGLPITVEAYPWGTGSTVIGASFYADPKFPEKTGRRYDSLQLVATGYRMKDRADVLAHAERDPSALVLTHFLQAGPGEPHLAELDAAITFPGGAIASDAMPWIDAEGDTYEGADWPLPERLFSHPRSSGTFARFFRHYIRERALLPLMEGISKCTLIPAQILQAAVPDMAKKGRMQVGCDGDILVFDPQTFGEKADFLQMNARSQGVRHLLVNGVPVILSGALQPDLRPGQPIRRL